MKFTAASLSTFLFVCAFGTQALSSTKPKNGELASAFHTTPGLQSKVNFWVDIYGKYTTSQGVVHDSKYLNKVYEILDFSGRDRERPRLSRNARKKWREALLSLHEHSKKGLVDPSRLNEEEKKVYGLYTDIDEPDKYLNAAHRKRLRMQLGQKDRIREGIEISGEYLPQIEKIFSDAGLPRELTRIPFVESSFNVKARSKVGASGIWQFILSTGRIYLHIDDAIDERNDPIRAAEAAAQLLKLNFESLGTWPMAVTAYNQGRKSMMRAIRVVGSDDFEIVAEDYRGRTFGFVGENYFACLLAALEVEGNSAKYFGELSRAESLKYVEAKLPAGIKMRDLIQFLKLDAAKLRELNPAFLSLILVSREWIPAGYRLRIPKSPKLKPAAAVRVFLAGFKKIPKKYKKRPGRYGSS